MCVALGRVEEEIANTCTRDVLVLRSDIGEDDARSNFRPGPGKGGLLEMSFADIWKAEEPEDSFWQICENAQPSAECCRLDLYALLVESLQETRMGETMLDDGVGGAYLVQLIEIPKNDNVVR